MKTPIFSSLSEGYLERLANIAILKKVEVGSYLVQAGDIWPCLFLLTGGRIKLIKESSEGRSLVIAELGPGELFWGLAFFKEGLENPVHLQALESSTLYLWRREDLLPLLLENGRLTWELTQILINRMVLASEVIDGLAFQSVAGRLARLLIEFPGQDGGGPIARSLTLDEMAARVGSTREMICRMMQKFGDEGIIHITRTEFEIIDRQHLELIAQKVRV